MTTTTSNKLTEAVRKFSSLGLAASILILLSNLLLMIDRYTALPNLLYCTIKVSALASFVILAIYFNNQSKEAEDEITKKNIDYVIVGCILGIVADFCFLADDILFSLSAENPIGLPEAVLLPCDIMLIAAFILLIYYFRFLKRQEVFSKKLDNTIFLVIISYAIKTVLNSYFFVSHVLKLSGLIEQGALVPPAVFTDIIYILLSIPMVVFFIKSKNRL